MIRRILIGLDGSEFSTSATALGIDWARRFGAELTGLGVLDEPTIVKGEAVPLGGSAYKQERDKLLLADARERVERFLERFGDDCRMAGVAWRLIEDVGLPYEQIVFEAQAYDVIVLGQQTYFHFETAHRKPCETLERVLRTSPRPVVTAPRTITAGTSIVIAYDGSVQAARALQLLQGLELHGSEPVHVVTIAKDLEEARRSARKAADYLSMHQIEALMHLEAAGGDPPADLILRRARELGAGLLAMGVYGQPTLKEMVLGSVTQAVLRDASIPLFLYH